MRLRDATSRSRCRTQSGFEHGVRETVGVVGRGLDQDVEIARGSRHAVQDRGDSPDDEVPNAFRAFTRGEAIGSSAAV
jgi:hypothetical protein